MKEDRFIVSAQTTTTTTIPICADPQTDTNCCGNHIKESYDGIVEECDYKDSDCECFENCDTSCNCIDFRPTKLTDCTYYDNCTNSTPGLECNCNLPPGTICHNENCWNATEEVCNGSSRVCNTWFVC